MAGIELPVRAIREQVAGAIDLIIQQTRLKDGTRRIVAVTEVVGMETDVMTMQDIYTFDYSAGRDDAGRFLGELVPTGIRPKFTQDLSDLGIELPDTSSSRGARDDSPRSRMLRRRRHRPRPVRAPHGASTGRRHRHGGDERRPGASTGATGVLTLRSTSPCSSTPASIVATIDGTPATVDGKQAPKLERRAMLVIDTSGSMGPAGMATVRTATAQYLKAAPPDVLVGVATFADTAGVDLPPTRDRAAASASSTDSPPAVTRASMPPWTSAVKALGTKGDRSIVLLSDGADTVSVTRESRRAAADSVKAAGVRTDVVQFKTTTRMAVTALRALRQPRTEGLSSRPRTPRRCRRRSRTRPRPSTPR